MAQRKSYTPGTHPDLPPPPTEVGVIGWLRRNLFATPTDTILTLLGFYIIYSLLPGLIEWSFVNAVWSANSRDECWAAMETPAGGACWAFVSVRMKQLLYGFYPNSEIWRINLACVLLIVALAPVLFDRVPGRKYLFWFTAIYPFVGGWLVFGWFLLPPVNSLDIGGLALTLLIGVTGIAFSLPAGIILALGRASRLPIIKILCVVFIEFIRGVPLIALLFIASTMLNYFLPPGTTFDLLVRVLIMVSLFASAYMAEVIRGGLAGIPKGQIEAANAAGLSYWKTMYLIVMPQVLKISIPGIVNTFIGLFKDTTLVLVIGMFDLLGMGRAALTDVKWIGLQREAYIFIAILFFFCCYGMSLYSSYLERKLDTENKFQKK
ncbi:amino acid ABC transporter permease [Alphaproteobacteria bacterium]|jgi:general L-amino acid transport system permease protein|nr:amino acid ABC transporter permease [Alphaproteobacteria bacterium]NCF48023.1 ABC transporter permease subunit [Bacteroidota bacterium]